MKEENHKDTQSLIHSGLSLAFAGHCCGSTLRNLRSALLSLISTWQFTQTLLHWKRFQARWNQLTQRSICCSTPNKCSTKIGGLKSTKRDPWRIQVSSPKGSWKGSLKGLKKFSLWILWILLLPLRLLAWKRRWPMMPSWFTALMTNKSRPNSSTNEINLGNSTCTAKIEFPFQWRSNNWHSLARGWSESFGKGICRFDPLLIR